MTSGTTACRRCGAQLSPGQRFCSSCGQDSLSTAASPQGTPPQPIAGGLTARLNDPAFWADIRVRARAQVLGLLGVGLITFIDFNLHDQLLGSLLVAAAGIGIMLFFREGINWLMAKMNLPENAIRWVQPLFFSGPAALYFLTRGAGTLNNSVLVSLAIGGLPLLANTLLPRFDLALSSFYETRDRILPGPVRPFVMVGITAVITFGLIHGNMGDVTVLFGSEANKIGPPSSSQVLLTTIITVIVAFALMRTPAKDEG